MWTTQNIPSQSGKIAVITGANTGIGFETALALHRAGATVILACRDEAKGRAAESALRKSNGTGAAHTMRLDLSSLEQVQDFAARFKAKFDRLDLLINNGGVMMPPPARTVDGFELQFGINFLGHFALTGHLYPLLESAGRARVVTLSSGAATQATGVNYQNLRMEQGYDAQREYAISKLANVQFAYELDRRLQTVGSSVISLAAHPGVVRTDLQRHIPAETLESAFAAFPEVSEPWQGALPALYAATHDGVQGGAFYGPDGDKEYTGYPARSKHSTPAMHDTTQWQQLREFAETATGITYP
jgi:NAD(P)-dependent dehydrogenase (short-subunit alcohol dehydrogenase family)